MSGTAKRRGFEYEIIDERPGFLVLEVSGVDAERAFQYESGGHRWQRVPPNEKRGRRHTSTVTVSVMPTFPEVEESIIRDNEVEWWATRGSGAGGQARNKISNCVMMKHIATGLTVRVETSRSQWQNRQSAKRLLAARLTDQFMEDFSGEENRLRRLHIGQGKRGDKIRTIRLQDDRVTDHRTGRSIAASKYLKGEVGLLVSETT